MIKSDTRTIDEVSFTVTQMPATKGLRVLGFVGKRIGPALSGIIKAAKSLRMGEKDEVDFDVLAVSVGELLQSLDEGDMERLLKEMVYDKTIMQDESGGKQVNASTFDALFQGRVGLALKLIAFAFEVNYADFFSALKSGLSSLPKAQRSPNSNAPTA